MPNYDMACSACGFEYETSAPITEGPSKKCPSCKKNKAVQQFNTVPGIIRYESPMHPRKGRGRGIGHISKIKDEKKE
jgi:putative FmdB family regulatory protein